MSHKVLSIAEEQGWRRLWDGYIVCPACQPPWLERTGLPFWPVPPTYDSAIGEAELEYDPPCSDCGTLPPLELTWITMRDVA